MTLYRKNGYKHFIITGQPITQWQDFMKFKNTAEGASAVLRSLGFSDSIFMAVIPKSVFIDRTYNTAVATRIIFERHPHWKHSFNIYSVGVHARRSRLMFERAFGSDFRVGIISVVDPTFDPRHWWRSSKGFRNVSNEFAAFSYVWTFFHPDYKLFRRNLLAGLYTDSITHERKMKDRELADSLTTPLNKASLKHFSGLDYFPVNESYRIKAKFEIDTSGSVFEMPTNTNRKPKFRVYGHLYFRLNDTLSRLTAYQSRNVNSDTVWGDYLFVPFRDKSCGKESYAAGRYIDLNIPHADSVVIDFNMAYNPYCAYAERWSCPLVPSENWLTVSVLAGERKFRNKR